MPKVVYESMFCFYEKWMNNEVVVVEL